MSTSASNLDPLLERCAGECLSRGWRLAWLMLRHREDAADAVQSAFVVALRKRGKIPQANPWPWLAAVIAREAMQIRRKRARVNFLDAGDSPMPEEPARGPLAELERRERDAQLAHALDELPAPERDALLLTQLGGLTYAQAAQSLGVPLGTFNHQVSRALAEMRKKLRKDEPAVARGLAALPILAPPAGLRESLAASASGTGTVATTAFGGLAVKKTLVVAGALVLIAMFGIPGAMLLFDNSSHVEPDRRLSVRPHQDGGVSDAAAASTQPRQSIGDAQETTVSDQRSEPTALEAEGAPIKPSEATDPVTSGSDSTESTAGSNTAAALAIEPLFTPSQSGALDPRNIATLGSSAPWTEQAEISAIVAAADDSCLFVASRHRVSRMNTRTGEFDWSVQTHEPWISSLALSPDGSTLAVGSNHLWIVLLAADSGRRAGAISTDSSTSSLAYSPDGSLLAAGHCAGVSLYATTPPARLRTLRTSDNRSIPWSSMRNLRFSDDGIHLCAARLGDGLSCSGLFVWSVATGQSVTEIKQGLLGLVFGNSVAFSRDGHTAYVAAMPEESHVMTFEQYLKEYPIIYKWKGDEADTHSWGEGLEQQRKLEYEDYRRKKAGAKESTVLARLIAVVNLAAAAVEFRIPLEGSTGVDVVLSMDSRESVLAAWQGRTLRFFECGTWSVKCNANVASRTRALAFDSTGLTAFANDHGRILRIRTTDGSETVPIEAQGLKPDNQFLSMYADGSAILFTQAAELICWEVASRSVLWRRKDLRYVIDGGSLRDGSAVVASDRDTLEPLLLDPRTGETLRRLSWPAQTKRNWVIVAAADGTIASLTGPATDKSEFTTEFIVWQPSLDYQPRRFAFDAGRFGLMASLAISPDGTTLACAAWQGYVIADVNSGTARLVQPHREFMNNLRLSFTPDGRELLAVALGLTGSVLRITVEDGSSPGLIEFGKLEGMGKAGPVSDFLVSPDGQSLLLAPYSWSGVDPTILRLDLAPPRIVDRFPGHPETINRLARSADGSMFASLSDDRVLRVWRMSE